MTIWNEDGSFKQPDMRDILHLSNRIAWDLIDKYPNPQDLGDHILRNYEKEKVDNGLLRKEYLKWWNKEHKKEWRKAIELAKKGVFSVQNNREKRIIV